MFLYLIGKVEKLEQALTKASYNGHNNFAPKFICSLGRPVKSKKYYKNKNKTEFCIMENVRVRDVRAKFGGVWTSQ